MKTIFAAALLAGCVSNVYAQSEEPKGPLVQLIEDLDAAIPRGHLSNTQRNQLDVDKATLEGARQARLKGESVNRMKIATALQDLKNIVDSGTFEEPDQQTIDADLQAVRKA